MWGTGASSTQCEGAAPASDWIEWEQEGRAPLSGEGNGFSRRYEEDFGLLAALGLTHHRLSIEWARIEPERGVHDQAAIAHYQAILAAARAAGIVPWVCLHHFTLPKWFAEAGGFLVEQNWREHWTRHVSFMAETFGDLVGGWQPVNEINYYAQVAYRARRWPPGHDDRDEAGIVAEAIQLAAAEAAVRLKVTGAPVASIFGLSSVVELDDLPATAAVARYLWGENWDAGIGLFRDGVLLVPSREPVVRPDLVGSFDLFGFSYYATIGVREGKMVPFPEDAPISPLGYGIAAEGLGRVLDRLAVELPGVPLLVAEYGIGTDDDSRRSDYLRDGVDVVKGALARGIDVRGLFHWTAVDKYEWHHGFDVSFGIITVDREVRPSARVLAAEALAAH
jgi:beta-glucosidase